jgi:hypothetical protein
MLVGLAGLAVVVMAARSNSPEQAPAQAQPPAQPEMMQTQSAPMPQDTLVRDSMTVGDLLLDSAAMQDAMATGAAAPEAAPFAPAAPAAVSAPTAWPVDPATGLTLVNGEPVVGRVFIQQKVDGLTKYESVASHMAAEAMPPAPATVGSSYTVPTLETTRRFRGIMVQSTLWSIDKKPSAVERRHFRPNTTGEALGQQY